MTANTCSLNSKQELDVLIIGGGISGLSTAWWLAQSGLNVQVWEKSGRPGGKIKTTTADGYTTEQAASMVMNFKPEVDQFFARSKLQALKEQRLLKAEASRYLLSEGKLQALPMTIGRLFLSPMWSTSGKLRLLKEPFIGRATKSNESVSEFIRRRLGNEFLEKAMEPFIAGTLASDPDRASAQHVIPRLTALEKHFGSITAGIFAHKLMGRRTARNPESFSFKHGMETLPQQLANDPAINFQANINVNKIIHHGAHHWEIQAQGNHGEMQCKARHVIIASPADSAGSLLQSLNPTLGQLLGDIVYAPLSVVHIGLQRSAVQHPLDSAGFLVPRNEMKAQNMAINGNLWMSSVFARRAPEQQVLLSSYLGGARLPSAAKLSTEASIARVLQDIEPLLGIKAEPLMGRLDRHDKALPLYHDDYAQRLAAIQAQLQTLPGLHLQGNYIGGVSIRDRIACARQTAAEIVSELAAQRQDNGRPEFNSSLLETPA